MARQENTLNESIIQWVQHWVLSEKKLPPIEILPLAGDGSTRCFFRLKTKSESFILLYDPKWILSRDYSSIQAFLCEKKLSTPEFYKEDASAGFLVMQDLGDNLLQNEISQKPQKKYDLLEKAILLLAKLHGNTYPVPKALPVFQRSFDAKKYSEELLYFDEHFRVKLLGLEPFNNSQKEEIQKFCFEIAQYKPQVFCHRDYHSRNILLHNKELYLIDFQDARMGCVQYDLVSLVFDAYIQLTNEERNKLIHLYKNEIKAYPLGHEIDFEIFDKNMYLVAYQRIIKAMGSFASFYTRNQKTTHLKYIPPALELVLEVEKNIQKPSLSKVFNLEHLKQLIYEYKN